MQHGPIFLNFGPDLSLGTIYIGTEAGCNVHDTECSDYMIGWEFLNSLSNYYVFFRGLCFIELKETSTLDVRNSVT
jgi:hypothetical protein